MALIGTRKLKVEIDGDEYTARDLEPPLHLGRGRQRLRHLRRRRRRRFASVQARGHGRPGRRRGLVLGPRLLPGRRRPRRHGDALRQRRPVRRRAALHLTVTIKEPDGDFLGGEANASTTAKFTFDFAFDAPARSASPPPADPMPMAAPAASGSSRPHGRHPGAARARARGRGPQGRLLVRSPTRAPAKPPCSPPRVRAARGRHPRQPGRSKAVVTAGRASVPYAGPINYGWAAHNIERLRLHAEGRRQVLAATTPCAAGARDQQADRTSRSALTSETRTPMTTPTSPPTRWSSRGPDRLRRDRDREAFGADLDSMRFSPCSCAPGVRRPRLDGATINDKGRLQAGDDLTIKHLNGSSPTRRRGRPGRAGDPEWGKATPPPTEGGGAGRLVPRHRPVSRDVPDP
jgi:hypothetical protein